ncbi:hypothetical protein ASPCAL12848 [Aspergillus calidoustus]|uniref:Exonuclease domain-containing protein n=1 Tax=Aspergillus calidoustus TaxID=454130 RepID=A0A0U5H6Q3_ASPCI|nr:hypothetical protein ASPCAL12848 [Aspergillus calidoustus]
MSKIRMSGAVPPKDRPTPQELRTMQFGDMPPAEQPRQIEEPVQTAEEPPSMSVIDRASTRPVVRLPPPSPTENSTTQNQAPQPIPVLDQRTPMTRTTTQQPSTGPHPLPRRGSWSVVPVIPLRRHEPRTSPVTPSPTARLGGQTQATPAASQRPTQPPTAPRAMQTSTQAQRPVPASAFARTPTHTPSASQHATNTPTAPRAMRERGSPYAQSRRGTHRTQQPAYTSAGPVVAERQEQMSAYGPQPGQSRRQSRSYEMPPPPVPFPSAAGQYYFHRNRSQPLDLVPEEEIARSAPAPSSKVPVLSTVRGARVEKSRAPSKASTTSSSSGVSSTKSKKSEGSIGRAPRRVSPEQRVAQLARSLNNSNLNAAASEFQPAAQAVHVAHRTNVRVKQARTQMERQALEELVLTSAQRDLAFSGLPDTANAARRDGWTRPTERQQDLFRRIIDQSHGLPLLRLNGYRGTDVADTFLRDPTDPQSLPRIVAMDCEMVGMEGHPGGQYTVRICLVDVLTGEVLMDHVILPPAGVRITDWRTQYSGMTQAVIDLYRREGRTVQGHQGAIDFMRQILDNRAHFVGHALHNDFNALGITHGNVIDTALLTQQAVTDQMAQAKERGRCGSMWSLSKLCKRFLSREIQVGHHSCLEDTYAARELLLYFALNGSALQAVTTWAREQVNGMTFTVYYDPPKQSDDEDKDGEDQQGGNNQK